MPNFFIYAHIIADKVGGGLPSRAKHSRVGKRFFVVALCAVTLVRHINDPMDNRTSVYGRAFVGTFKKQ